MELLRPVLEQGCKSVAVVGMAKNAGKTVTLNRLIGEAAQAGIKLGLTSSGRDGEREDVLWRNPKPPVWAPQGTILATARGVLQLATAPLKVIRETQFTSALGPVCLAEVLSEGFVQLAGPGVGKHLAAAVGDLARLGAALVLVDGAFDRMVTAAPTITDGMILATGAILAESPEQVLERTKVRVEQLMVPGLSEEQIQSIGSVRGSVNLWLENGRLIDTKLPSAIGEAPAIDQLLKETPVKGLVLKGALTETTVEAVNWVLKQQGSFALVVSDPTKIFLSPKSWRNFHGQGGQVLTLRPIKLLALTLNPCSPTGHNFDPAHFLTLARSTITHLPIFNPLTQSITQYRKPEK